MLRHVFLIFNKLFFHFLILSFSFLIYAAEPVTYAHSSFGTHITTQRLTLYPDSTFTWKRNRLWMVLEYPEDSLWGTYSLKNDTLILNSCERKIVRIKTAKRRVHSKYRQVRMRGETGIEHPFFLTSVNEIGDTCVRYGKGNMNIPVSERILEIEDAYYSPYKIIDTVLFNSDKNISLTVSDKRVFENEKWLIQGDTVYPKNLNGYAEFPLVIGGVGVCEVLRPAAFIENFDHNGLGAMPIGDKPNIEYWREAQKHNFHCKGTLMEIVIFDRSKSLCRGWVLVDSHYILMYGSYNNPVAVGQWIVFNDDGTEQYVNGETIDIAQLVRNYGPELNPYIYGNKEYLVPSPVIITPCRLDENMEDSQFGIIM